MDIVFFIVCLVCGISLGAGIGFAIGKIQGADKWPNWVTEVICAILILGGAFAGAWFADYYKQSLIEQEHTRQYDNCRDQALSDEQCRYFQSTMNN